nr:nucleotide-binding alpha-beta plait domain-containing protein [Tanacetum cinerariifolium]
MAEESERDVKVATQLVDAMDVGNGGVDQVEKVVDVYIAFKRTKRDTRFGFVRFINTRDVEGFERHLKGIIIVESNLIINCARFNKLGGLDFSASYFSPIKKIGHGQIRRKLAPPSHSFKEVVLDCKVEYVRGLSFLFGWKSKDVSVKNLKDNRETCKKDGDDVLSSSMEVKIDGALCWNGISVHIANMMNEVIIMF